jgi:hypothetical protein
MTEEEIRLKEALDHRVHWRRWGPYLAERQWGTVREDYSADGAAWDHFPHDHARSRAYRWGEDGLLGISDNHQRLCFAIALWNGRDPILKERLFGLANDEGNHGEDVKEYYFYLDSTPTHSYMKALYRYPQREFPYASLVEENRRRGRQLPEYELIDTGILNDNRYFDVSVEYAKAAPDDILIRISAVNRAPDTAPLHLLPILWFRNTWSWHPNGARPKLAAVQGSGAELMLRADHETLGTFWLLAETAEMLFTENETNRERLFHVPNRSYVKDAFHQYVIDRNKQSVNPEKVGTKAAL